jgi:hypothetical protein
MLCTWAGDHGIAGRGVDISSAFLPPPLPGPRSWAWATLGEPYWAKEPPDEATIRGCRAAAREEYRSLPALVQQFAELGWDLVEMVLASPDDWDRYTAAQWPSTRRFLDEHPDDDLASEMRAELDTTPLRHVTYQRDYLGWGVFALMKRQLPSKR